MTRPIDDDTKPSRLKRRRKKHWRVSDLIESGLTDCSRVAINLNKDAVYRAAKA